MDSPEFIAFFCHVYSFFAPGVAWYQLSWWGYLLLFYPFSLYLDDSLHFYPHNEAMERLNVMDLFNAIQNQ